MKTQIPDVCVPCASNPVFPSSFFFVFTTHSTVWTHRCRVGKKLKIKHFFLFGRQMPIYIIAAIESKCFCICIFFYKLDIWLFSCARATSDSPSLNCDEFIFFISSPSFVFCCVCVYARFVFFSLLFSRLRLHLNEQWHWMPSYCLHVCFVA